MSVQSSVENTPAVVAVTRQSATVTEVAPWLPTSALLAPRRFARWRVRTAQPRTFRASDSTVKCAHLVNALDPIGDDIQSIT